MGEPKQVVTDDIATAGARPRAMIHKKILDIARANPDASLSAIAAETSGASEKFVERVLEEYGDPARSGSEAKRADGFGHGESQATDSQPDTDSDETTSEERPLKDTEATEAEPDRQSQEPATTESESLLGNSTGKSAREVSAQSRPASTGSDADTSERVTDPAELTAKQLETLRLVYQNPTATQEEIASALDVTRATISKRVNEIPGFDWANRRAFANELFDDEPATTRNAGLTGSSTESSLDDLASRVSTLEARLSDGGSDVAGGLDPELAQKVIHACIDAEYVTQEDELELLRVIL